MDYDSKIYWDEKYKKEVSTFDWFLRYNGLKEILNKLIEKNHQGKILIAGCGNSLLSEDMSDDGYNEIVNVDFSSVVIDQMKSRQDTNNTHVKENDLANFYATVFYKVYNMEWLTMDLTSMYNFKDCSFRCVIDKATWDCILCAERSREATERYLSEIYRILNDDGIFIVITYGHRSNRLCFLNQFDWEITMYQLLKPFLGAENSENEKFYNLFVCKKIPSSI